MNSGGGVVAFVMLHEARFHATSKHTCWPYRKGRSAWVEPTSLWHPLRLSAAPDGIAPFNAGSVGHVGGIARDTDPSVGAEENTAPLTIIGTVRERTDG